MYVAHLHYGQPVKLRRQPRDRYDDPLYDFARARRYGPISRDGKRHRSYSQERHSQEAAARQIEDFDRRFAFSLLSAVSDKLYGGKHAHRDGRGGGEKK